MYTMVKATAQGEPTRCSMFLGQETEKPKPEKGPKNVTILRKYHKIHLSYFLSEIWVLKMRKMTKPRTVFDRVKSKIKWKIGHFI